MSSIRRPESIASLIKMSTTTLSFPSSVVNIGAMQYKNITSLILSTSFVGVGGLDAVLQTRSTYYVYAVAINNIMNIIGSTNSSMPSGYTQSRQVGSFTTNSSGFVEIPSVNPPGVIAPYGGITAPAGWLLCDGSAVSQTTYAALYSALYDSTTSKPAWGNPGGGSFNLPDLRGRFLRGRDASIGRDPDRAGRTVSNAGGNDADNVGSVQGHEFYSHGHSMYAAQAGGSQDVGWCFYRLPGGTQLNVQTIGVWGAGGNESRPINANVNYIIKF